LHHGWNDLKSVVNNFNDNPLIRAILELDVEDHLSMPGKLMGYSAFGHVDERTYQWLTDKEWFVRDDRETLEIVAEYAQHLGQKIYKLDPRMPHSQGFSACIQRAFEDKVMEKILEFQKRTGAQNLYYTGGAALNILANQRLERCGAFSRVFSTPAPNDTGLALGAAAWLEYINYGSLPCHTPYLNNFGISDTENIVPIEDAVALLVRRGILGLWIGAAEIGPRALGHRSLLARPDDIPLRRQLSEQVKQREWYRPVAPVVTDYMAETIFGRGSLRSNLAPFMLTARTIDEPWRKRFCGVIHADDTVRIQIIRKSDPENKILYKILDQLWHQHEIPGLINTSFNCAGEPLIHTLADALSRADSMGIDAVLTPSKLHYFPT